MKYSTHQPWQAASLENVRVLALCFALIVAIGAPASAQTFRVIHIFDEAGGAIPIVGLTIDRAGNLYGTTYVGGSSDCGGGQGCGVVFKLSRAGSGWVYSKIYTFTGVGSDGGYPEGRVAFGPDGTLYGTTSADGFGLYGTVFNLRPPASICRSISCPWTETVLYSFNFSPNVGAEPSGDLAFDSAGNIYGTTELGGYMQGCSGLGCGLVYQLTRSGGAWTENILYTFNGANDGGVPRSGVLRTPDGNLYGTADYGGPGYGVAYQLTPSQSGWTQNVLYSFQDNGDGEFPRGGLISDGAGNLYGATSHSGMYGQDGTIYELTPSGGNGNFNLLYTLTGSPGQDGPEGTLVRDAAGNFYGANYGAGAFNRGSIFKLSPSNGGWVYTTLYDFTGRSDGGYPFDGIVIDANGNLFGTASAGGQGGCDFSTCGVVWEITP